MISYGSSYGPVIDIIMGQSLISWLMSAITGCMAVAAFENVTADIDTYVAAGLPHSSFVNVEIMNTSGKCTVDHCG